MKDVSKSIWTASLWAISNNTNTLVTKIDVEEYCSFHTGWFLDRGVQLWHLSAVDAIHPFWGDKRLLHKANVGFCIEEALSRAHRCIASPMAKMELIR